MADEKGKQVVKIEFEAMCEENITEIAQLEKLSFSKPWSENSLRNELSNKTSNFFLARINGVSAGYIGVHVILDEAFIANIAVHPDYRNKGIGRKILEQAHTVVKEKGVKTISLEVRPSNTAAVRLYKSLDYEEKGVRKNFYTSPAEDGLILTRTIV